MDFYVVCDRVLPLVQSMKIFNHTDHNLTNYHKKNDTYEAVSSEHAPLSMEVRLEAKPTKKERVEIPNFQDIESQLKFKKATSETSVFYTMF